jgi:Ca2+-binding EF-hand superfamily protein
MKQKQADWIDRSTKSTTQVAKLQTQLRKLNECEDKLKAYEDDKAETEADLDMIKKRLESVDVNYRWENAIFNKIVAILKRLKISPDQAFKHFDKNGDGRLSRQEFVSALDQMRVNELTAKEIDILISSMDIDQDNCIKYKEFVRRLGRYGVKSITSEEQIIYVLNEAIRKSGMNLSETFEIIDKEGDGVISKEDFREFF